MRVLPVAELAGLLQREPDEPWKFTRCGLLREPGGDRQVVRRRVGEGLGGQPKPRRPRERPLQLQLIGHHRIPVGAHDDADGLEVLRGRANHRRPTDVDLLDHVFEPGPGRHRLPERVEVHDHQLEGFDPVLGELIQMLLEP